MYSGIALDIQKDTNIALKCAGFSLLDCLTLLSCTKSYEQNIVIGKSGCVCECFSIGVDVYGGCSDYGELLFENHRIECKVDRLEREMLHEWNFCPPTGNLRVHKF